MYWNSISIDNSSGAKGDKICVVYGHGAFVVGKADGAIALDLRVKPSDTTSHNGQFKAHTVPTVADEGDTSMVDLGAEIAAATQAVYTYYDNTIGIYRGHVQQGPESGTTRTDASDEETDIVVEIVRV